MYGYVQGLGLLIRDTGTETGNYYSILGLYRDTGESTGNYYLGLRA